jgi:hypothetical protein
VTVLPEQQQMPGDIVGGRLRPRLAIAPLGGANVMSGPAQSLGRQEMPIDVASSPARNVGGRRQVGERSRLSEGGAKLPVWDDNAITTLMP